MFREKKQGTFFQTLRQTPDTALINIKARREKNEGFSPNLTLTILQTRLCKLIGSEKNKGFYPNIVLLNITNTNFTNTHVPPPPRIFFTLSISHSRLLQANRFLKKRILHFIDTAITSTKVREKKIGSFSQNFTIYILQTQLLLAQRLREKKTGDFLRSLQFTFYSHSYYKHRCSERKNRKIFSQPCIIHLLDTTFTNKQVRRKKTEDLIQTLDFYLIIQTRLLKTNGFQNNKEFF